MGRSVEQSNTPRCLPYDVALVSLTIGLHVPLWAPDMELTGIVAGGEVGNLGVLSLLFKRQSRLVNVER